MGGRLRAGALAAAMLLACPVLAADRWITSWGSAQMVPTGANALPDTTTPRTIRQVIRLSAGGKRLRVRFSNVFGREPLTIGAAGIGRPVAGGGLAAGSSRALTFAGRATVTIAAGAEAYADPVALATAAGDDLAVSLYLPVTPVGQTGHPGARATSFVGAGDQTAAERLSGATTSVSWWLLADVEVEAPESAATIVAIGDSITDGYGVEPDSNTRWTDTLAQRLRADPATATIGVVNAGIGGNRVLLDGLGPNLLARFDRDVIARSGVRWAILLEGVNDLGVLTRDAPASAAAHAAIVAGLQQAYGEVAARARAHGIQLIAGTIMPFTGNDYYHPDAQIEADRQAINQFIRTSGLFAAVIDFDKLMRDPAQPDRLLPAYDSGDHLHPSAAGYRAMGAAIPLGLFASAPSGPAPKLALTFDDMPEHGPLPEGMTPGQPIREMVAALKAGGVAAPHGFLNAARNPGADGAGALKAWSAAGFPLGNHGFAHRNLDDIDAAGFERELTANEPTLRGLMRTRDWHWFRYPFLAEGATAVQREQARAVLRRHGYRIAAVTMDFGDYAWNGAYARCLAKRDDAGIAELEESYLQAARVAAARSRAAAHVAYGGDIPYVLLMHVGAFDARMLPRLLTLYRTLGFDFVPLATAQQHPAYRASMDLAQPGPSVDTRAADQVALSRIPLPDATTCA